MHMPRFWLYHYLDLPRSPVFWVTLHWASRPAGPLDRAIWQGQMPPLWRQCRVTVGAIMDMTLAHDWEGALHTRRADGDCLARCTAYPGVLYRMGQ